MSLRIATLTDFEETPSSRFRMRQYFSNLESRGIYLHDFYRRYSTETAGSINGNIRIRHNFTLIVKAIMHETANIGLRLIDIINANKYDAIWLSRQLIIGYPTFEHLIKKPLIYDIDDAIYLTGKSSYLQFKIACKKSSAIIAGNNFLAEEASKYCGNVHVVPTAVDTNRWFPKEFVNNNLSEETEFKIGWSGTSASFYYLQPYQAEINKFLNDFPCAKIYIMSDRFPYELNQLKSRVNFIKWSSEIEVDFIRSLHVGLMPLKDDLWSRGKCAYKMLLYASCGIPVIVTPVGVNKTILEMEDIGFGPIQKGEWYASLQELYKDTAKHKRFSENAVRLVNEKFSVNIFAPIIEKILIQSV